MSARQERITRKKRQRDGTESYVHTNPAKGTRPYETREQTQKRRHTEMTTQQIATAAAALALRFAPAARASVLSGGRHFGEDQ